MREAQASDFKVGDVVRHVFHGRCATVTKVGRSLLQVTVHLSDQKVTWLPTSVTKVDG